MERNHQHLQWGRIRATGRSIGWASSMAAFLLLAHAPRAVAQLRADVVESTQILESASPTPDARHTTYVSRDGQRMRLLLQPSADEILNPSFDGALHPIEATQVLASLAEMRRLGDSSLDVVIYCLPGLPEGVSGSFCVGREVFLSPSLAPPPPAQVASTLVHELGHAVDHALLSVGAASGWQTYLELRSLDPEIYNAGALHRDRPAEIFAEDFRILYGGSSANYSGSQENHSLPDPRQVAGLANFFRDLLRGRYAVGSALTGVSNHPNPFNPSTTIVVRLRPEQLAPGTRVHIDIFDLRGRRVRSFPDQTAAERIGMTWDGSDDRGRTVASGRYTYRVRVGHEAMMGSMLLLQ